MSMSKTVWNFFVHVNGAVMREFILDLVSWGVDYMCWFVVTVVSSVVIIGVTVVIDWVNEHLVGSIVVSVVVVMVNIVVDIVVHWLVVDIVVHDWMVVVVDVFVYVVMSWLSNVRSTVNVVMVGAGNNWLDVMILSVLVLGSVSRFVVLHWSSVSVNWLGV